MNGNIILKMLIEDDKEVRHYNDMALESEIMLSKKFVIGEISELERLSTLMKVKRVLFQSI